MLRYTYLIFSEVSSHALELTCPNEIRHDVIEVIDRAGIYTLEVEFHSATEIGQGKDDVLNAPRNIMLSLYTINRTGTAFAKWFTEFCSLIGQNVILLPTNNNLS